MGAALEKGGTFALAPEEAHHVIKVLRGRPGDVFEVVDGTRSLFVAELQTTSQAAILEELGRSEEVGVEISLFQAVPKGKNMDLVVEKTTELGVDRVVPLLAERSVARPAGESGKVARWRRMAEAAARQSLQLRVPSVEEPVKFADAARRAGDSGVLLHNVGGLPPLEEAVSESAVGLFVGPEGGWSEAETRLAEEIGMPLAQLGSYRLRSETAGIVSVARARAALERHAEKL